MQINELISDERIYPFEGAKFALIALVCTQQPTMHKGDCSSSAQSSCSLRTESCTALVL